MISPGARLRNVANLPSDWYLADEIPASFALVMNGDGEAAQDLTLDILMADFPQCHRWLRYGGEPMPDGRPKHLQGLPRWHAPPKFEVRPDPLPLPRQIPDLPLKRKPPAWTAETLAKREKRRLQAAQRKQRKEARRAMQEKQARQRLTTLTKKNIADRDSDLRTESKKLISYFIPTWRLRGHTEAEIFELTRNWLCSESMAKKVIALEQSARKSHA